MSAPQNINPLADLINTVIYGITTGVEAPVIKAIAEAKFPFLALPIVKQIFEAIVDSLLGKVSVVEQQGAIMLVFNIDASMKLSGISKSALALKKARESGDANAIEKAKQDAFDKWGETIHFGGIAPVKH